MGWVGLLAGISSLIFQILAIKGLLPAQTELPQPLLFLKISSEVQFLQNEPKFALDSFRKIR